MSQPVKLSDALVLDARLAGEAQERSIAGQVEFWAKLGQSIDALLKGPQVSALHRAARTESLAERLASVDTPAGRARVEVYLKTRPYPHYKEGGQPGLLTRIDADGTETTGRFVNRVFVPVEAEENLILKAQLAGIAGSKPLPKSPTRRTKKSPQTTPKVSKMRTGSRMKMERV